MTLKISEAAFQAQVIQLARLKGWRVAHFRKAQNGKGQWRTPVAADGAGFPDLVLVRDRVIFAELKTNAGQLSPDQRAWRNALADVGSGHCHECGGVTEYLRWEVWRPRDWDHITEALA